MAPSSNRPSPAPTPGRRPPFPLRTSSSTRKASNPSLSLVYASPNSSLPSPPATSSSTSRCEEALSRQLDGDLGGKQMGLRSRRSSTATLRTINTNNGASGGGGPQSPRESIAEEEEEPEVQQAGVKEEEIRRTRLNPKASSSWLRWNSPTASFPKGKGKEKIGDRTPVRRVSTVAPIGDDGEDESKDEEEGGLEGVIMTKPPGLEDDGLNISNASGSGLIPPPADAKSRGWFSKNPPRAPPTLNPASSPESTTQDSSPDNKGSSRQVDPDQTAESSNGIKGATDAAESTSPLPQSDGEANEQVVQQPSTEAGGWKGYLTWGRKGGSRPPIPTIPEPSEPVSEATEAIAAEVQPTVEEPEREVTEQAASPSPPEQAFDEPGPVPAPETPSTAATTTEATRQTWGSFLYGIVIPQTGSTPTQTASNTITASTSEAIAPTSATTEQPPVHIEPIETDVQPEEPIDSSSLAPAAAIEEPKSKLSANTATTSRKGSQASTTAGWLNYLAFRASQKKVENPASSVVTAETGQEIMDFSNDPNFPTEPADSKESKTPINVKLDMKGSMKPPAGLPDKKKRLSSSSMKSATSVIPIPPSPQSQARNGTAVSTPAPSQKASALPPPPQLPATQPNLVIPAFTTTFDRPPRSFLPPKPPPTSPGPTPQPGLAWRALGAMGSYVYPGQEKVEVKVESDPKETRGRKEGREIGMDLPRRIGLAGENVDDGWRNVKRIVVVGVHGWFPAKIVNSVIGEPTGTSSKFANMMGQAVRKFFDDKGIDDIRLTLIPLEGEGTIEHRVDRLYKSYLSNPAWINDLRRADAIFFAAHSQGCVVTTHLISRLIAQGHIKTPLNAEAVARCSWAFGPVSIVPPSEPRNPRSRLASTVPVNVEEGGYQKVCMLAMCGVHQGPFYSIGTSTVIQPYLQWFESPAARELFQFQETTSAVSQAYQRALAMVLENEVRVVLLSSLNDQVVPIYGSSFSAASHPLLLRALYVDGASYSASDFMTNLICFSFMLRNAGLSDQHLIEHLSEATAGSLTGLGHSTPYEEPASFALAVEYLFHVAPLTGPSPELLLDHFSAREGRNDFELPWIMRALVDSPEIKDLFPGELRDLKEGVLHWKPTTKALKDIKKKLEPMAGRQSKIGQLRSSPSSASLASGVEPGSPAGNKLLAPPAGKPKPMKSRL